MSNDELRWVILFELAPIECRAFLNTDKFILRQAWLSLSALSFADLRFFFTLITLVLCIG